MPSQRTHNRRGPRGGGHHCRLPGSSHPPVEVRAMSSLVVVKWNGCSPLRLARGNLGSASPSRGRPLPHRMTRPASLGLAYAQQDLVLHSANIFTASQRSDHVVSEPSARVEPSLQSPTPMRLDRFSRYEKIVGVAQDSAAPACQSPRLSAA